jgi:hypothetical protein
MFWIGGKSEVETGKAKTSRKNQKPQVRLLINRSHPKRKKNNNEDKSAQKTASTVGISTRKVEKARTVLEHAREPVKEALDRKRKHQRNEKGKFTMPPNGGTVTGKSASAKGTRWEREIHSTSLK